MENIRVMISEEDVNKRIAEMGAQISEDYAGKEIHLIAILKGSVFFACELAKRITIPVTIDFMSVSSYGNSREFSGIVKIAKDLDEPIFPPAGSSTRASVSVVAWPSAFSSRLFNR